LVALRPFHDSYVVMTRNLSQAIINDYFMAPQRVERLMIDFAQYYFRALNDYVEDGRLPQVWQRVIGGRRFTNSPAVSLLLGASAHIKHDLPLALAGRIDAPELFYADFMTINKVVVVTVQELIGNYEPAWLQPMAARLLARELIRWRRRAWAKFLILRRTEATAAAALYLLD
jgi:hypothetical protein